MKKYILLFLVTLLTSILLSPSLAADIFQGYQKVIWINQLKQKGEAYENGGKIMEFPVLTGDDETTTDPGIYVVRVKDADYFSWKYQTPMPYSIFFDYTGESGDSRRRSTGTALQRIGLATHGCVHVEQPFISRLYDWTETGRTLVVIMGRRTEE